MRHLAALTASLLIFMVAAMSHGRDDARTNDIDPMTRPEPAVRRGLSAGGIRSNGNGSALPIRMCRIQLKHPYYFADLGHSATALEFWDKQRWERVLTDRAAEGYNAIYWWISPWTIKPWQSWLIAHRDFPEARELTPEQSERFIEHIGWIFRKAHELGMMNFLHNQCIATTKPFAEAHGLQGKSVGGEFRGIEWGDRNELTTRFTELTLAELFQTYEDLDGMIGPMGDVLPGKRSSWYKEAIVPGLKLSGRDPIYIVMTWQLPFDDFLEDIAPPEIYPNTWINVDFNGEMITDNRPYPIYLRWAEQSGLPTIFEILDLNFEGNLPFNSPKFAFDIIKNLRKVDNCVGFNYWGEAWRDRETYLFRKALGHYAKQFGPYSEEPWLAILEEKFGDRAAAEHFLRAYDASAWITPEVCAIAWCPIATLQGRQLSLKYWYFSNMGKNLRIGYYNGTARGTTLLPVKYYAWVVAELGEDWVAGNPVGNDETVPPHEQLYKWELADHPVAPHEHMERIRLLGQQAQREAEEAMKTVKQNNDEATEVYHAMTAYKLLAAYYERKVLAATSALIYGFGGPEEYRAKAERLADEVVDLYEQAAHYIWEHVDRKQGRLKGWGGWHMGERPPSTLLELIEAEKEERAHFSKLFNWSPGS